MNKELRPLSELSEFKQELFKKYIKFINPPETYVKACKKEFKAVMQLRPMTMPYFFVQELIALGFDVEEESLDDKF